MHYQKSMWGCLSAAMVFSLLTVSCSSSQDGTDPTSETNPVAEMIAQNESSGEPSASIVSLADSSQVYSADLTNIFTDRDLSGSYDAITADITLEGDSATVDGAGAAVNGTDITITDEGTYRISGTLNDGQILVASEGKVQLLLNGVDLTCLDSAPIYIQSAKKIFITMVEGTENSVTDGSTYTYAVEGDNEPDAAIFSKDSLTLNGSGTLRINGNYNEGITCKDDLVIAGCTLNVTAAGNGIKGKDYVAIAGGTISVTAGSDGIKSDNAADAGMGFIYIENGTVTVDAQEDGIQAETELIVKGGTLDIMSGGGTANAEAHVSNDFGGRGGWNDTGTETTDAVDTVSTKGMKAGTLLYLENGTVAINSADDGFHSNGNIFLGGGVTTIAAGDDGIHADAQAEITGGSITVSQSYEGIEAANILIGGGTVAITASDDGFNASDGTSQGAMGTVSDCGLEISGGTIYVNADGDGLDSNGSLLISSGTVLVDGSVNSGNGALDSNGSIICSGGLLVAAGSSGMAEYPSGTQQTLVLTLDSFQAAGTLVTLCDDNGNEILSYAPAKEFNSVIISTPDILSGSSYSVFLGGTTNSSQQYGLYETGGYQGDGTEAGSFTAEDSISYIGTAGGSMDFHGTMGGDHGGMDGGRGGHEDFPISTDENGNEILPEDMPEDMKPPEDMHPGGNEMERPGES